MSMLASPLPHARPRRMTRAEYERLGELGFFRGERVELIRGIVVEMPPIGPPHASTVDQLNELLVPSLLGRARVRIQQPFLAWDESEPEPDVAVVAPGRYAHEHPDAALLIIEVAESSLDYDRDTKGPLYARSNVFEYWIVDVSRNEVLVFRQPKTDGYDSVERASMGEVLTPIHFPDVAVAVSDIFR